MLSNHTVTAIWIWHRQDFDYLNVGDGEGFFHFESFPIGPPFSLQRVIARFATAGQGSLRTNVNVEQIPGYIVQQRVFMDTPDGRLTYWSGAVPAQVSTNTISVLGGQEVDEQWTYAFGPIECDVEPHTRVPDGATGWSVGFSHFYTPVPTQQLSTHAYGTDFRTYGSFHYLISGTP